MAEVSPEDYEKIMLAADDMIKKSKGFMLSVVNHKGDFQSIAYYGELDSMQQIGFVRAATRICEVSEDAIIGDYNFNNESLSGDQGEASEGGPDGDPV